MKQLLMRRPDLENLPQPPVLPEGYTMREARESDHEALAQMMRTAFEDPKWTQETLRSSLLNAADVKKTFVIDVNGVPVATASARLLPELYPGSGYVHFVAVDPAYRGQGLGFAVTLEVLYELARLGCKDAVLETDDHRLAAIKIYRDLGFEPEHRDESHPERWAEILSNLLAAMNL